MNQQSMFADGSESRALRRDAFVDWSGINVPLGVERFRKLRAHRVDERVELGADRFVIVSSPRVTGNPSARRNVAGLRGGELRGIWLRGVVVHGADNHAVRARHYLLRRFAPRIGEVAHFSGVSASEPFGNAREFRPFGIVGWI